MEETKPYFYINKFDLKEVDKNSSIYSQLSKWVELKDEIDDLKTMINKLYGIYDKHSLSVGNNDVFEKLHNLRTELKLEKERLSKSILAYQESCDHKMTYTGHDSHKNYYTCRICGFENWS